MAASGGSRPVGFVGRQAELAALHIEAEAARGGFTRLALVTGEPGAGKTALAARFAERLAVEGFRVARTACASIAGAPDLLPWHLLLRDLGLAAGSTSDRSDQAEFAQVTGVADALADAAGAQPLLVVIDDLHRAGPATAAPLAYLAELAPPAPLLLLGLVREPPGTQAEFGRAATNLVLRGLSAEEAAELAADLAGRVLPARMVSELTRRCDGNPGLICDLIRRLDASQLRDSGVERLVLDWSSEVRTAANVALAPLDEHTRSVLEAASVIGREFDLAILERILPDGLDPIRAIDLALASGVLAPRSSQVFAFGRALVREVLYDSLGVVRRAGLHESVAATLADFRRHVGERGPTVAEFAHHLIAAAALGGDDRLDLAIAYATAAGVAATADGRHHDASAYHETALDLAVRAGWPAGPLGRLTVALGRAYLTAGNATKARAALSAAVRSARQVGDAALLAEAALAYGPRAAVGLAAPDAELVGLLREARAAQLSADHAVRVTARMAVELAGTPEATDLLAEADAMARVAAPRPATELRLAQALGVPTREFADAALRAAIELGDPLLECEALAAAATAALLAGDVAAGTGALERLARTGPAARHPLAWWWGECALATLATVAGRLEDAERALLVAREVGRALANDVGDLGYAAQLSAIRVAQGRGSELAPLLAELNRGARPVPDWLTALSARVALDQDRPAIAAAIVGTAESADAWATALLGEVALELGEPSAIARLDAQLAECAPAGWLVLGPAIVCGGPVALLRARLRLALDDRDGAEPLLRFADEAAADTLWQPVAELTRAEWLATTDAEAARTLVVSAGSRAARLGLAPIAVRAERLATRLAAVTSVGPSVLTRREQEVLDLALAGESARGIAARLFISERTAESHLANIYRKLNVRSRVELLTRRFP